MSYTVYGLRSILVAAIVSWATTSSATPPTATPHMMANGKCRYELPNGSLCYAASGECYGPSPSREYIGNFNSDCNATGAVAVASGVETTTAPPPGPPPPGCALAGTGCGTNGGLSCCGGHNDLQCEKDKQHLADAGDKTYCCHGMDGGAGGTCDNSQGPGGYQCCQKMDCLNSECVYDVGWSALQQASAVNGLSGAESPGRFNYIGETMTVPAKPSVPADNNVLVLWFGVSGANQNLMQPELWWNQTAGEWTMEAQFEATATNQGYPSGTQYVENEGDTLWGSAYIESPDTGDGAYWVVEINDPHGNQSWIEMGLPPDTHGTGPGNPGMTTAYSGVLEVQGLKACDGLPVVPENWFVFQLTQLAQQGTGTYGWETYIDATGAIGLGGWSNNGSVIPGPNCYYTGATVFQGGYYFAELYWEN